MRSVIKLLVLILGSLPVLTLAQVNVSSIHVKVECCSDSDSIDYNQDGTYDFKMEVSFGFDAPFYIPRPLNSKEMHFTSATDSLEEFRWSSIFTAATALGCSEWGGWVPGPGAKFVGFREVVAPGDTIYGWIRGHFIGNPDSCNVIMIFEKVAYRTEPNITIKPGEIGITGIKEGRPLGLSVYPVPAKDFIMVKAENLFEEVAIFDVSGKKLSKDYLLLPNKTISIPLSNLPDGMFILRGENVRRVLVISH